jgi:hypothetical protein
MTKAKDENANNNNNNKAIIRAGRAPLAAKNTLSTLFIREHEVLARL